MDNSKLEQFIKEQGWSAYGVVSFENVSKNLKKHESVFQEWVDKGFEADMDYLKRMKNDRFHPENKLVDVKSVIVLGAIYSDSDGNGKSYSKSNSYSKSKSCDEKNTITITNTNTLTSFNSKGVIARYARGKDYHKVLKKKLIELSDWLKNNLQTTNLPTGQAGYNLQTYCSVDSGPTVDRVLAESAGLGFFGKNSCIINPSRGSYFFIASIYTNLELPETSNKRMPNCGNCQKCIKNCPTGALVAPGVVNAQKCISYLTIENKGGIPEEFRHKIGNRIFGCDACQEICPFNVGRAHHQEITIDSLKSDYGVGECLNLKEILSIKSDKEFVERFAGTPLMRAKKRGLLRNACIVAGNSGNKELIPVLEMVIKRESDEMIKEHAEWAIRNLSK